tara:strand:+ start:2241 stop:3125 length:885 start_codon:yes stop_codon:yes gene_type:complete
MAEEQLNTVEETENDELTVEVEEPEAESSEIEVSDDSDETSGEDQFDKAHNATQKRINQLTKKMRQAERDREEAIRYATQVQSEAQTLKQRVDALDSGYVNEFSGRVQSELQAAENDLKNAIEIGDSSQIVESQRKITALAIQADRAAQAQRNAEAQKAAMEASQAQPQQAQPQQAPRRPDPKAEAWAADREWFGSDETMTYAAFGIHKQLIEDEGFDPSSDDYYSELDKRMADAFPHKFNNGSRGKRPAQTVASVNRSASGRSKRRVTLTPTQVSMAKKLGVPLEEYAKYVKE